MMGSCVIASFHTREEYLLRVRRNAVQWEVFSEEVVAVFPDNVHGVLLPQLGEQRKQEGRAPNDFVVGREVDERVAGGLNRHGVGDGLLCVLAAGKHNDRV